MLFFMSAFSYTDTLKVSYGYNGTVLQAKPDYKSHDLSSKGLVKSVLLWAEKRSCFLGVQTPVSLGRQSFICGRGMQGVCVAGQGHRQSCASSLPPSLTLPCLRTPEWLKSNNSICVHTPHFQSASGPKGLVQFSLGLILQFFLNLLALSCFPSSSPWTSFSDLFHICIILQKSKRYQSTPDCVLWLVG